MKPLYLAYCGLGKTVFSQKSSLHIFETPLRPILDLSRGLDLSFHKDINTNTQTIDVLYKFIFSYLLENQPDTLLLGPSIPAVYEAMHRCFEDKFNIYVLLPERSLFNEYAQRYEERATEFEIVNNKVQKQKNSWDPWHDFFEEKSKIDPNIIYTKAGEYLTDYLDIKTGEFKRPELLSS